jgi:steroid 5-alpha reductase family enzyme
MMAEMTQTLLPLLLALAVTVIGFGVFWLISLRIHDVSIVDLYWGPGFAVIGLTHLAFKGSTASPAAILLLGLTGAWALRLTWHIHARRAVMPQEDARYAAMRRNGGEAFAKRSFWTIFMLQALIMFGLALPLHLAFLMPATQPILWLALVGSLIFLAGLTLESIADAALLAFKRDPGNAGKLMQIGPFAWSRNPNYFGESVLWFGLGLIAVSASASLLPLLGPAALTMLILTVSGLPLKEKHLAATRPGYAEYARRTSAFIPWPPKTATDTTLDRQTG